MNKKITSFTPNRTAKTAAVLVITFALLFSAVASNTFVPRQAEAATQSRLLVSAVDMDGKALHMWTVVSTSDGSSNLLAGWTPFTYTGEVGKTYTVTANDWTAGKLYFDHWTDGSKDRKKIVTLSATTATTLKSYTRNGVTAAPTTGTLKINAIASDGVAVNMWTTVSSGNTLLATGFTPFTFTGTYGKPYTVTMANYEGLEFGHWTDGSTNNPRTFTLYQSASFTASYNNVAQSEPVQTVVIVPTPASPPPAPNPTTGVYVPLYMYPSGTGWTHWQKVIDTKNAHPSVPFTVAINPNNGAGSSMNTAFVNGIDKLQAANIRVLGYIAANYADRSLDSLKAEIDKYISWYDIDGIMVDEFSNQASDLPYFQSLYSYAKSKGLFVKANPGTDIPESYVGTADNFSISEGLGYFDLSRLQGWHTNYDKSKWSFTRHTTPSLDTNFVEDAAPYVGMMYITDGVSPVRYSHIPYYFGTMATTLDNLS